MLWSVELAAKGSGDDQGFFPSRVSRVKFGSLMVPPRRVASCREGAVAAPLEVMGNAQSPAGTFVAVGGMRLFPRRIASSNFRALPVRRCRSR